jgi:hypothetical protein
LDLEDREERGFVTASAALTSGTAVASVVLRVFFEALLDCMRSILAGENRLVSFCFIFALMCFMD